ncbi:NERD domain-containing protein [bacterium]|nr:NERD domain-containing protein [bacterium]QQR58344.1 MAG: NERD domain-containing protein [Candidatus Melainabacteria bacterium]
MTSISWQRVGELERQSSNLRKVLIVLIAGPGIINLFFGVNFSLLFISACLALAARLFRHLQSVSMDVENLTQGLAAEEQVFHWLELLPCDWSVERRIEVDGADIDLLVTTPNGVSVAIEVKSHEGEIRLLNNKLIRKGNYNLDGDFISVLKKRASKLAMRRGLPSIACVIVFTRAKLEVPHASVDGVFVRDLMELIPFLHKIDTQTRKFNAIRSINKNIELTQVVAEEEEPYETVLNCNPELVSLENLIRNIGFYVSHDYSAKLHQCYRCKEWIVVFTWQDHEMWSEAMPPKPIPRSIKYRYSKSLHKKYWVNTCQKCGATQGDSFVHQGQKNDQESWTFIYNSAPIYFKG